MIGEWIELDRAALDKPQKGRFRGADIELRLSPYDIPEAVRGIWQIPKQVFRIEFKYIGGEEPIDELVPDGTDALVLHVGRNSKRLYKIDVDVQKIKDGEHGLRLNILHEVHAALSSSRYSAAREAIEEQDLVPA